jgi:nucleotide-binding universal stress UspA family protein
LGGSLGMPIYMKHRSYKILVTIDFSDHSRYAVEFALNAFGNRLTHLYLLHAYKENSPDNAPLISLIDILRQKSERLMLQEVNNLEPLLEDGHIILRTFSRFDGFLHSMTDIVQSEDIDLVVIGTNGHTHPRLDQRDDDPSFLIHKLNKPILLVPKVAN